MKSDEMGTRKILFFDGYCGLCDHFVNFLMKRDLKRNLFFATLGGQTFNNLLSAGQKKRVEEVDSVLLFDEKSGTLLTHSRAAMSAISIISGPWAVIAKVAGLCPTFVADLFYKLIAAGRYRIFGKSDSCRLPSAEEKSFFLD